MTSIFSKDRIWQASYFTLAFRIAANLSGIAAYVLLVRFLTEEEFGVYSILYALIGLVATVASLGIANTVSRYGPEYIRAEQFNRAKRLFRFATVGRFSVNAILVVVMILGWELFSGWFELTNHFDAFLVFCFVLVTHFQARLLSVALRSVLLQKFSFGIEALFSLSKVIGYSIAFTYGFSLHSALVVDLVAYLLMWALMCLAYVKNVVPLEGGESFFGRTERRRLFRYAIYYNFNDIGGFGLGLRADHLLIGAMLNPVAVGAYAFCTRLGQVVESIYPVRFLVGVIRPVFFTLRPGDDRESVRVYFSLLLKSTYLIQIPVLAAVVALSEELIIVVFDGKFLEYSLLLIVVLSFMTLSAFAPSVTLVAQLHERARLMFASKFMGLVNIAANILVIPRYGIMGVAVVTGVCLFLRSAFVWYFVWVYAPLRKVGGFVFYSLLCWASYVLAIQILSRWITDSITLLATGCLLGAIWGLVYLRLPLFTEEERRTLEEVGGPREKRYLTALGLI